MKLIFKTIPQKFFDFEDFSDIYSFPIFFCRKIPDSAWAFFMSVGEVTRKKWCQTTQTRWQEDGKQILKAFRNEKSQTTQFALRLFVII